jgi:hypothetical protein
MASDGRRIDFRLGSRRSSLSNLAPSSAATNHRRRRNDDRNTHTHSNEWIYLLIDFDLFGFFICALTGLLMISFGHYFPSYQLPTFGSK